MAGLRRPGSPETAITAEPPDENADYGQKATAMVTVSAVNRNVICLSSPATVDE